MLKSAPHQSFIYDIWHILLYARVSHYGKSGVYRRRIALAHFFLGRSLLDYGQVVFR